MTLRQKIEEKIRAHGPILFSRYMEMCLYDPELGYYSRDAEQFGKNITSGTPLGFSVSTNTYGALLVLALTVSAGVALQRRKDGDSWGWVIPIALTVPPANQGRCSVASILLRIRRQPTPVG